MLIAMLVSQTAIADCQTNLALCDSALNSCSQALEARKEEVKLCRLGLSQSIERNAVLERTVQDQNDKLQSPLRNPFVMTALGLVIGVLGAKFVTK